MGDITLVLHGVINDIPVGVEQPHAVCDHAVGIGKQDVVRRGLYLQAVVPELCLEQFDQVKVSLATGYVRLLGEDSGRRGLVFRGGGGAKKVSFLAP